MVAVATAKAQELGLGTIACSSTGNLAGAVAARAAAEGLERGGLLPREPRAREARRRVGLRGDDLRRRRHVRRLLAGSRSSCRSSSSWGFVNVGLRSYYAEGSKTIAFELAEQLGWTLPDVVVCPIASGALFHKLLQGFEQLRAVGSSTARCRG